VRCRYEYPRGIDRTPDREEIRSTPGTKELPAKVTSDSHTPQRATPRFLLFLFAVVGCTAFAYEIAWTRLLAVTIGSSTYAFTLMLVAFLVGIVIGSAFFHRYFASSGELSITTFSQTQIGIGIAALSSMVFFHRIVAFVPALLRGTDQTFGGTDSGTICCKRLDRAPGSHSLRFQFSNGRRLA